MSSRTTQEVFESHLQYRRNKDVEADIAENYAEDVVFLTGTGVYRGHDGVRQSAAELQHYLPHAEYEYTNQLVEGEVAFLEWHAYTGDHEVTDGADSFVIRDGKIVAQTIHYTVREL